MTISLNSKDSFYLVDVSPWPIFTTFAALNLTLASGFFWGVLFII